MKEKFVIIDGNALVHRAYHAITSLVSPQGQPVNAVYGFFMILFSALKELKPKYIVATFDVAKKTFRHDVFKDYKATRIKQPDNLYDQIPLIKELLEKLNIPIFEQEGYEADDVIGSIVNQINGDLDITIVTGDLDLLQLLKENVTVWTLKKGIKDSIIYDIPKFKKRYNLEVDQFIDYKGIKGDPSDNIPGVKGLGDISAQKLLKKHHSIENIIKEGEKIVQDPLVPDKEKKLYIKFLEHKDEALFSKQLATIITNLDINLKLNDCLFYIENPQDAISAFRQYGFISLIKQIQDNFVNLKSENLSENKIILEISSLKEIKEFSDTVFCYFDTQGKYLERIFNYFYFLINENIFKIKKENIQNSDLKELFKNKEIVTFDAKVLYQEFDLDEFEFQDLKIYEWLINSDKSNFDLTYLSKKYTNILSNNIEDIFPNMPTIYESIKQEINKSNLQDIYDYIDGPLIKVLSLMEKNGISLDIIKLNELVDEIKPQIEEIEKKIFKLTNKKINLKSPKQVSELLFQDLKIPISKLKKTKTKQISTNSDELQKIIDVHPVVPLILKYRELIKLLDSFLIPLPTFIAKDLRIHTIWNQTGTTSGRLSSESPNLQNIPHYGENGTKIRACFTSLKGFSIVSFDYSQMELRVAATLSQDKELLNAFLNNKDVHTNTASLIFNIPYDKISKEERQKAKTLNFGLLYGMGSRALAKQAEITVAEAKEFVTEYFSHYYNLKNYLEELQNFAIENNYCQTEYGRKRYLPFASYLNQQGASERRIAINMPIQGLASDIIKISMNNIFNYLKENNLLNKAKLILQIHDELVFEIQNDIIDKVSPEIKKLLEENDKNIPLKVDIKKGPNWGEIK